MLAFVTNGACQWVLQQLVFCMYATTNELFLWRMRGCMCTGVFNSWCMDHADPEDNKADARLKDLATLRCDFVWNR